MSSGLLYHITDYRNLPSILKKGHLLAHSQVVSQNISHSDIAHQTIQKNRSITQVSMPPYGVLHDYVPFHFAPRSPMLYALNKGMVGGYDEPQSNIIYLVTRVDKLSQADKSFVFTDGHAIVALTEFYNDLADLDKVDWDVMKSQFWYDTNEDPDRKRRRQAEFLVYHSVELELFLGIGVKNERMKTNVNEILNEYNTEMTVLIRPFFYY